MKCLFFLTLLCGLGLASNPGVYIISRIYEGAFFYVHYNYFGLSDPSLYKKMSYGEKLLCLKNDFSNEMLECLEGKEPESLWIFSEKKHMKTFWVSFHGKEYIVKKHVQFGSLKNLMKIGKCISIWNNLHWANDNNIDVVTPVALSEKRTLTRLETTIVYRYEGNRTDYYPKDEMQLKTCSITPQLRKKNIVHADLRRRNIVYSEIEDKLKLIDVELMHFYPSFSYVCYKRLTQEEKWLVKDYKY